MENVTVASIEFPQKRTPWTVVRSEYRIRPYIVGKDGKEQLILAIAVKHPVHLHQILTQKPVPLFPRHRPCIVPFPGKQPMSPSYVWIVADGVPTLEVPDYLHRKTETLLFSHGWWMFLRHHHQGREHQQDGNRQPCQCPMIAIACPQRSALHYQCRHFPRC